MLEVLALLIGSLVVLMVSSEAIISSSVTIARFIGLSELAIGFVLLSIATGFPELTVSLTAALNNQPEIVAGDTIGSSLTDVAIVLGITAVAGGSLVVRRKEMFDVVKILFASSILPLIMILYHFSSFVVGVILLYVFFLYSYVIIKEGITLEEKVEVRKIKPLWAGINAVILLTGLVFLVTSAEYVVKFAAALAELVGLSKSFIAATIVAAGTSLPELAVNLTAVRKKKHSLIIGNTLGSSIVNVTLILGFASLINPVVTNLLPFLNMVIFLIITNLVLWYSMQTQQKISRRTGLILVGTYVLFILSALGIELRI